MQILVASDLHMESGNIPQVCPALKEQADLVILAGDIHRHTHGILWASKEFNGKPVVYVAGNHEYDDAHLWGCQQEMRKIAQDLGIHFLENDVLEFNGYRILGTTLWSDYLLYGDKNQKQCMYAQNRIIPAFINARGARGEQVLASDMLKMNRQAYKFLSDELAKADQHRNIVVTHFAPTAEAVLPKYWGTAEPASFASAYPELVRQAKVWIHGHTHVKSEHVEEGCCIITHASDNPSNSKDLFRLVTI